MLEYLRTNAAKVAVTSDSLAEHFQIVKDIGSRERASATVLSSDSLLLEAPE